MLSILNNWMLQVLCVPLSLDAHVMLFCGHGQTQGIRTNDKLTLILEYLA